MCLLDIAVSLFILSPLIPYLSRKTERWFLITRLYNIVADDMPRSWLEVLRWVSTFITQPPHLSALCANIRLVVLTSHFCVGLSRRTAFHIPQQVFPRRKKIIYVHHMSRIKFTVLCILTWSFQMMLGPLPTSVHISIYNIIHLVQFEKVNQFCWNWNSGLCGSMKGFLGCDSAIELQIWH